MTGATVVVMVDCGDKILKQDEVVWGLHPVWSHRKALIFNGVGTSTTSGILEIRMAIRLQESDMVIPGCVHSHEILEKTHPLGMTMTCA